MHNLEFKQYKIEDFPEYGNKSETGKEFWDTVESPAFRSSALYLALNTIRSADPVMLTDSQCKAQLSKIFALVQVVDFKEILLNNKKEDELEQRDELPE